MTQVLALTAVHAAAPNPPHAAARAASRAPPATAAGSEASAADRDVPEAVNAANRALAMESTRLRFDIDSSNDRMIVRIVDGETGQVLRQMPSEEMLALARRLDRIQGMLLRDNV
ncbi:MAG: flagellar protein FlaG [Burkholderiales bacterium]